MGVFSMEYGVTLRSNTAAVRYAIGAAQGHEGGDPAVRGHGATWGRQCAANHQA